MMTSSEISYEESHLLFDNNFDSKNCLLSQASHSTLPIS